MKPESGLLLLDATGNYSAPVLGTPAGDLPVGTPGNDTLVKFLTFLGAPIVWRVIGKNLPGMPDGSITLLSDKILALRSFDAREVYSSNVHADTSGGNNNWSVSNIRQWMNSPAAAGQWYSPQHGADNPPSEEYLNPAVGSPKIAYDQKPGMLNESKPSEINLLLSTTRHCGKYPGDSSVSNDHIFLLSTNELGLENVNNNGTKIPYFTDDNSRITSCTPECKSDAGGYSTQNYWTSTGDPEYAGTVKRVTNYGTLNSYRANETGHGVRPACNIPANAILSTEPDADGCYTLTA